MKPSKISYLITMGDSLSDRGTFYNRYLFGFIPLRKISGLEKESPAGRFTNGLVWSDHVSAMIINELFITELKEKHHFDSTDIADGIVGHASTVEQSLHSAYTLTNDQFVKFKGNPIIRNYTEAGLSAHKYHWNLCKNLSLTLYRNLVSTLSDMREKLFAHDKAMGLSAKQKEETLIVEWSGSNDLIFVNERPSKASADKAIEARIENLKLLIQHGYRNFVLFNLPDLSLTPRYQSMSIDEQNNARECSIYFNEKFAAAYKEVAASHLECSIDEFDVFGTFTRGYKNPTKYGFDEKKIKCPYVQSSDFKLTKSTNDTTSSAHGYMFWDDVHPTAYFHALVGERFYNQFRRKFYFCAPSGSKEGTGTDIEEKTNPIKKVLLGTLTAAAVATGIRKASSMLGISDQATTVGLGVGFGLAAVGLFAKKQTGNPSHQEKDCHDTSKEW